MFEAPNTNKKTSVIDFLEKAIKASSLAYVCLVLCGSLFLDIYYSYFSIVIFQYLDFSEILMSFLSVLKIILFFFCLTICFLLIVEFASKKRMNENKVKDKTFMSAKVWLSISFIITFLVVITAYNTRIDCLRNKYFMPSLLVIFSIHIILTSATLWTEYKSEEDHISIIVISFLLAFILSSSFVAIGTINGTIERVKTDNTSFILNDNDTITVNPTHYYLGRTNKYIFLFNTRDGSRDVIPVSDIKKITLKEKR